MTVGRGPGVVTSRTLPPPWTPMSVVGTGGRSCPKIFRLAPSGRSSLAYGVITERTGLGLVLNSARVADGAIVLLPVSPVIGSARACRVAPARTETSLTPRHKGELPCVLHGRAAGRADTGLTFTFARSAVS